MQASVYWLLSLHFPYDVWLMKYGGNFSFQSHGKINCRYIDNLWIVFNVKSKESNYFNLFTDRNFFVAHEIFDYFWIFFLKKVDFWATQYWQILTHLWCWIYFKNSQLNSLKKIKLNSLWKNDVSGSFSPKHFPSTKMRNFATFVAC